jgi:hypothetical protein
LTGGWLLKLYKETSDPYWTTCFASEEWGMKYYSWISVWLYICLYSGSNLVRKAVQLY